MAKESPSLSAIADHSAPVNVHHEAAQGQKMVLPLNSLFLSPSNVRKGEPSKVRIEEMAATLLAAGQIYDLLVTEEIKNGKSTGRYGVEAGGRRLRGFWLLRDKNQISPDFPIKCDLISADKATELSLIENVTQEQMHPADQFAAFKDLIDQGRTPIEVAQRFGVTPNRVLRRLKLASLAAPILQAFRAGETTLDVAMLLAGVDKQSAQLQIWKQVPEHGRSQTHYFRNLIVRDEMKSDDPMLKLISMDEYTAHGGSTRLDLFDGEDGVYRLSDPGLVHMLVAEKVNARALTVEKEGWAWVQVLETYGYQERQMYRPAGKRYLPENEEVRAKREALENTMSQLEDKYDDCDEPEQYEELETQIEAVQSEIQSLMESRVDTSDIDKSQYGAVVTVENGKIVVHRNLTLPTRSKSSSAGNASEDQLSDTPKKKVDVVPERLMVNLTSHRTAAIQAAMATNQRVCLAALAERLASKVIANDLYSTSAIKINLTDCTYSLEKNGSQMPGSKAFIQMQATLQQWRERLPEDKGTWLAWLIGQPEQTTIDLIVFCTANSVDAIQRSEGGSGAAPQLEQALHLDMTEWWTASPEHYLALVPKTKLAAAVLEVTGEQSKADSLAKMKKAEAIAYAAEQLKGSKWLPAPLKPHSAQDRSEEQLGLGGIEDDQAD